MSFLGKIINSKQQQLTLKRERYREDLLLAKLKNKHLKHKPVDVFALLANRATDQNVNLIAEYKRASPSEGDINTDATCQEQILKYLVGGAFGISVLTEQDWFKGSLVDLEKARQIINHWNQTHLHNLPPVFLLQKDFIFTAYQIYESILAGADTILLIITVFRRVYPDDYLDQLKDHLAIARKYGLEPIIEVNDQGELNDALAIAAKIIGLNTRNLETFQLDNSKIGLLMSTIPPEKQVIMFSGIKSQMDIINYRQYHLRHYLVGTTLMKSPNPTRMLHYLGKKTPLVKICGIQDVETARQLVGLPIDFIGLVFANSKRQVDLEQAEKIINIIRSKRQAQQAGYLKSKLKLILPKKEYFAYLVERTIQETQTPLIVGVFQNQPVNMVNKISENLNLDLIQLHGTETNLHYSKPIIKSYSLEVGQDTTKLSSQKLFHNPYDSILIDSKYQGQEGGTGKCFSHHLIKPYQTRYPFILAGGLTPDNISDIIEEITPWIVDVSSGVELNGVKDIELVKRFLEQVKGRL